MVRSRRRGALLGILLSFSPSVGLAESDCKGCTNFPVPRAEAEFRDLMNVPRGFAHGGRVPIEQILVNLMPYAPLDVQITGKATHEEISKLKNYYFGAVCSALGVDPGRLNAAFNCGRVCVEARRNQIKGALDAWSEVATRFRAASGVELDLFL